MPPPPQPDARSALRLGQQIGARSVLFWPPAWVLHTGFTEHCLGSDSSLRKTPKSKACTQRQ